MMTEDTAGWANTDEQKMPEDFPEPILWRILIAPRIPKKVSKGGIVIPVEAQDAQQHLNYVGQIVAMGELAWKSERFEGQQNPPKVGDFVVYGRYAGQKLDHRGFKFLIVNDDEILGRVRDPESLTIYV
jgi:co-chaperonin GroES (HSP10)